MWPKKGLPVIQISWNFVWWALFTLGIHVQSLKKIENFAQNGVVMFPGNVELDFTKYGFPIGFQVYEFVPSGVPRSLVLLNWEFSDPP